MWLGELYLPFAIVELLDDSFDLEHLDVFVSYVAIDFHTAGSLHYFDRIKLIDYFRSNHVILHLILIHPPVLALILLKLDKLIG